MKVEQRIGRIDRLGQKYPKVRIINLAYKGTVEADVYFVVGARIQLFQGIVGKLQPILSRLPKQIEQVLLETADNRDALRQRFLAEVDQQVAEAERTTLDIDTASFESLEVPPLPEAAMTLVQIDAVLRDGRQCRRRSNGNHWTRGRIRCGCRGWQRRPASPPIPTCSNTPARITNFSPQVGNCSPRRSRSVPANRRRRKVRESVG